MAKDEKVKKTDLTPEDMVQVIRDGGSVMVGGEIISTYDELPPEARKLAAKAIIGDSADAAPADDKDKGKK